MENKNTVHVKKITLLKWEQVQIQIVLESFIWVTATKLLTILTQIIIKNFDIIITENILIWFGWQNAGENVYVFLYQVTLFAFWHNKNTEKKTIIKKDLVMVFQNNFETILHL